VAPSTDGEAVGRRRGTKIVRAKRLIPTTLQMSFFLFLCGLVSRIMSTVYLVS